MRVYTQVPSSRLHFTSDMASDSTALLLAVLFETLPMSWFVPLLLPAFSLSSSSQCCGGLNSAPEKGILSLPTPLPTLVGVSGDPTILLSFADSGVKGVAATISISPIGVRGVLADPARHLSLRGVPTTFET